jgi:hypothetical protein
VLRVGEQMDRGKKLYGMPARTRERRCRKKKRIVNILKISLDVQDPVFFGRLIAWPPLHARYIHCFSKRISHSEEALFYSTLGGGMLNGGFRVRAAPDKNIGTSPRRGKAKVLLLFQNPLHPANKDAHQHDSKKVINPKCQSSTGAAEVLRVTV